MDNRLEALERIARLRDQKVLSEAEFEAEKVRLLSGQQDVEYERQRFDLISFVRKPFVWGAGLILVASIAEYYLGNSATDKGASEDPPKPVTGNEPNETRIQTEPIRLSAIL